MDKEFNPKTELTDEELMDMLGGFDVTADEAISADAVTVTVDKYYEPQMPWRLCQYKTHNGWVCIWREQVLLI